MIRISIACLFLFASVASACVLEADQNITAAVDGTASSDPAVAAKSVATLRSIGPAALKTLLDRYDAAPDPKLIPAIEAVAAQRGAVVSRLFWYTDLDQAMLAARAGNKPILYLRMMGKLTDEYSCANSRFFRTVLYANADVSRMLREQFILVWISERPVPVVTIDYGDGRILKRTLTGNSIHYILDVDGHVIDALPGLYAPKTFLSALASARGVALAAKGKDQAVSRYLERTDDGLLRNWQSDIALANGEAQSVNTVIVQAAPGRAPLAPAAMRVAIGKSVVEAPILAQIDPRFAAYLEQSIDKADAAMWDKIAALHLSDSQLDASSIAVIRGQNPKAYNNPAALNKLVEHFQKLIALDTVHNNFQLRRQIIAWLRQSPGKISVEDLNQRVYSELFLTPKSDPWLGLAPEEYTALSGDGCEVAKR